MERLAVLEGPVTGFQLAGPRIDCVCGRELLKLGKGSGQLLLLDKKTLSLEKSLVLGKKNTGSLYLDSGALYAASHEGKLFRISLGSLEVQAVRRKAHRKMFHSAGVYGEMLRGNFLPLLGNSPVGEKHPGQDSIHREPSAAQRAGIY